MAQEKLDWAGLDAVWISHFHLDHCGGLAPFLFGTKHAPDTRDRTKPLRIFGPQGLERLIDAFDSANGYGLLEQRFPVETREVEALAEFEIAAGVFGVAGKTPHTDESHAIHIRDGDSTLAYTADTGFSEVVAELARGVSLLAIECSFVKAKPVEKHLELAEAMYMIRKAAPKRALLTHLYPEWDDVEFTAEVNRFEPLCEVIEAVDGLRLTI